jgi:hypothetical protein
VTEAANGVLRPTVRRSGAVDSLVTGELAADLDAKPTESEVVRYMV